MRAAEQRCDFFDTVPAINSTGLEEVEERYRYIFRKRQLWSTGFDEIARFILCGSKHDRYIIATAGIALCIPSFVPHRHPRQVGACMSSPPTHPPQRAGS